VECVVDALRPRAAGRVGDELGQHLGVRRRAKLNTLLGELVAQPPRVGEVAVVAQHQLAQVGAHVDRLDVRQRVRPGRAVPGVADGRQRRRAMLGITLQPRQRLLVEHAADEAEPLVEAELRAVGDGDPGRLLATVLERVKADIRHARDRGAGRPDTDHAALLARTVRLIHGQRVRDVDWRAHSGGQVGRCGAGTGQS
jgi:hypothetical protein